MDLAGYYFVRELASRELVYGRSGVPGFSEYGPNEIAGIVLYARGFLVILFPPDPPVGLAIEETQYLSMEVSTCVFQTTGVLPRTGGCEIRVLCGPRVNAFSLASREVGTPQKPSRTPLSVSPTCGRRASLTAPWIQNCPTGFWLGPYWPAPLGLAGAGCRSAVAVALRASCFWRRSFFALFLIKIAARYGPTSNTPPMHCACCKESETGLRSKKF